MALANCAVVVSICSSTTTPFSRGGSIRSPSSSPSCECYHTLATSTDTGTFSSQAVESSWKLSLQKLGWLTSSVTGGRERGLYHGGG